MRSYRATSLKGSTPITFTIDCDGEVHSFRIPRKNRPDIVAAAAQAVRLDGARRVVDEMLLRNCLIAMCAREVWVDDEEQAPAVEGDEPRERSGRWENCDDGERLAELFLSHRFSLEGEELRDLLFDLIEEVTGHPTLAPKP